MGEVLENFSEKKLTTKFSETDLIESVTNVIFSAKSVIDNELSKICVTEDKEMAPIIEEVGGVLENIKAQSLKHCSHNSHFVDNCLRPNLSVIPECNIRHIEAELEKQRRVISTHLIEIETSVAELQYECLKLLKKKEKYQDTDISVGKEKDDQKKINSGENVIDRLIQSKIKKKAFEIREMTGYVNTAFRRTKNFFDQMRNIAKETGHWDEENQVCTLTELQANEFELKKHIANSFSNALNSCYASYDPTRPDVTSNRGAQGYFSDLGIDHQMALADISKFMNSKYAESSKLDNELVTALTKIKQLNEGKSKEERQTFDLEIPLDKYLKTANFLKEMANKYYPVVVEFNRRRHIIPFNEDAMLKEVKLPKRLEN